MQVAIIHIANEEPILGELDNIPSPADVMILVRNPRRRDGKDLSYLGANVTTVMWPVSRVNFIELMPNEDEEDIITFVRE